ncbi:hypothetical protein [Agrobacterium larrymoorei]|uniref:Acetyl-CoA carboxylase n=1 Tax=Agrobacterium larrymoorei TaxID=160699 RepID=A0A4D7DYQ2_9HYPH|nr:hypothetical protein [Agrobacterium larrymoorei]QCJ00608.1 acetyl-CoA carboxylase [Agrobacterium larrymoorei]QYA10606.1 acetyl-CoA carboxylase [Agrobacterium larrymoorei]
MSRLDFTDPATLAALTEMLTTAGVEGLEITTPDTGVKLVVPSSGKAVISSKAMSAQLTSATTVKAPIAGLFHLAPPADGEAFPRPVTTDTVVGFIRIGHVLVPVIAGRAGLLTGQLAEQDALVGFGDPLFEIELHS